MDHVDTSPIEGEIVGLEATGALVRLEGGQEGHLPAPSSKGVRVGDKHFFHIEGAGVDARPKLTIARIGPAAPEDRAAFEKEFDRLHDALANHAPHRPQPLQQQEILGEQAVEAWMGRVDATLSRLRKRRAKRGGRRD